MNTVSASWTAARVSDLGWNAMGSLGVSTGRLPYAETVAEFVANSSFARPVPGADLASFWTAVRTSQPHSEPVPA